MSLNFRKFGCSYHWIVLFYEFSAFTFVIIGAVVGLSISMCRTKGVSTPKEKRTSAVHQYYANFLK